MQEFLCRRIYERVEFEDEEEDDMDEEGRVLGRRARDSIDVNIERAWSWESKAKRTKKNQGGGLKAVGSWLKKLVCSR